MVDRHEANSDKTPIIAVDLDGTYIAANTLHEYIKAGILANLRNWHPWKALKIISLVTLRRIKAISHVKMKFGCASIIGTDPESMRIFSDSVIAKRSPAVGALIKKYEDEGCMVLIASAALDFYIPYVTEYPFIATAFANSPDRTEMRGERKAQELLKWLDAHNATLKAVITDHPDDAAMLRLECQDKFLANPKTGEIKVFTGDFESLSRR